MRILLADDDYTPFAEIQIGDDGEQQVFCFMHGELDQTRSITSTDDLIENIARTHHNTHHS